MATYIGGGNNPGTSGATSGLPPRQLQNGSMATSTYSNRYYEAARSGMMFNVVFGATGTGIVIPVLGTSGGVALYNPLGSGRNLSLISVAVGIVSGTLILGSIMHGVNTNVGAAATTGTANTPVASYAGSSATAVGKPLYTTTLPANQTPARVFFYKQPTIATGNSIVLRDDVDGQISLAPGATWSLYGIGDDTNDLWQVSCTWIEEQVS